MKNTMNYRGYMTGLEFDSNDNILVGCVLDIDDLISFHGESVAEFMQAFHGYQLKTGQIKVKPFVVSLSNHERLNRPSFDKLRANG